MTGTDLARDRERWQRVRTTVGLDHGPSPVLGEVLVHHEPVLVTYEPWPVCEGCDIDGHDAEPPQWPCSTFHLIERLTTTNGEPPHGT